MQKKRPAQADNPMNKWQRGLLKARSQPEEVVPIPQTVLQDWQARVRAQRPGSVRLELGTASRASLQAVAYPVSRPVFLPEPKAVPVVRGWCPKEEPAWQTSLVPLMSEACQRWPLSAPLPQQPSASVAQAASRALGAEGERAALLLAEGACSAAGAAAAQALMEAAVVARSRARMAAVAAERRRFVCRTCGAGHASPWEVGECAARQKEARALLGAADGRGARSCGVDLPRRAWLPPREALLARPMGPEETRLRAEALQALEQRCVVAQASDDETCCNVTGQPLPLCWVETLSEWCLVGAVRLVAPVDGAPAGAVVLRRALPEDHPQSCAALRTMDTLQLLDAVKRGGVASAEDLRKGGGAMGGGGLG